MADKQVGAIQDGLNLPRMYKDMGNGTFALMGYSMSRIPGDSNGDAQTSSAPTAGAVVVTITPSAGDYRIDVVTFQFGTLDNKFNNMGLYVNGTLRTRLLSCSTPVITTYYATCDGTNPINIQAIASAGALTTYGASLSISKVG